MTSSPTIAVIGGTGKLGAAIARRLAKAGRKVISVRAWPKAATRWRTSWALA